MKNLSAPYSLAVLTLVFILGCQPKVDSTKLGAFEAFAEMVHAGNKPVALGHPMSTEEADAFWPEAKKIAEKYGVEIFRESDLIKSGLFDLNDLQGMEVIIIYTGDNLDAYLACKKAISSLDRTSEEFLAVSRSFGRLLGYPSWRINELLAANTAFRDLEDFDLKGQELIWFYKDLAKAKKFYSETLGLKLVTEDPNSAKFQIAGDSYLTLKSLKGSGYSGSEPKSVALALLTDHLDEWYAHVKEEGVEIKYTLKKNPKGAHDGFVAIDPEGYLLEFETFLQHPENEILMPQLWKQERVVTSAGPNLDFYGSVTWFYYEDMLPMQNFMQEDLGLILTVDQGWAKVYRLSDQSYLGLVDAFRGMNEFSEEKLVEVKFDLEDAIGWEEFLKKSDQDSSRTAMTFKDLGGYLFRF